MEIKSVRNSATGIADQRPYSPNLTGKIIRNKINSANDRKKVIRPDKWPFPQDISRIAEKILIPLNRKPKP